MKKIYLIILLPVIFVISVIIILNLKEKKNMPVSPLVVYSSVDEVNTKKILDAFTEDTGITAVFIHLSSGPALERIESEKNNPGADVWFGAPMENHIIAKNNGLTEQFDSGALAAIDEQFRDKDGYWCGFYMNPLAFAVNTDMLKELGIHEPLSWYDLLGPEYRNLIQMPSPISSGTAYNIITTLITVMGEEHAFAYMKELNNNIQVYTSSGTGPSNAVALGQCAVGIQFTPLFFDYLSQGYPLKIIFPEEGTGYEVSAVSVIKDSHNREAAFRLIEWLISEKGQDTLSSCSTYFYPVRDASVLSPGMPELSQLELVNPDSEWAGINKGRLIDRWVSEIQTD
jgi:iron(III) transport system substrate-binding protein